MPAVKTNPTFLHDGQIVVRITNSFARTRYLMFPAGRPVCVIRIECQNTFTIHELTPPTATSLPPRNVHRRRYNFPLVSFSIRRKRQTFARRVSNFKRFVLNYKIIVLGHPVTDVHCRVSFRSPSPPRGIEFETIIPFEKS